MSDEGKSEEQLTRDLAELRHRVEELEGAKTELRRAEKALRESEELHRVILSNMSDAVFITDDGGAFVYICSNVDVIFGYSNQEVEELGNITALLGDGFVDHEQLRSSGEMKNVAREITDKSGNGHSLLVNVKGVSIKGGTLLYTCRDITERKQAEDELLTEKEKLDNIVKGIGAGLSLLDSETRFTWANETLQGWFGPIEEIRGRRCYELYEHKDAEKECAALRTLRSGRIEQGEAFAYTIGGERNYFQVVTAPILGEDGKIVQIVELTEDITERKRAEEELLALKEFNENVVQSIQEGLFAVDRDLRITLWNRAMEKISGLPVAEALGKDAFDLLPCLAEQGVGEQLQAALEGEASARSHIPFYTSKGKAGFTNERYLPLWNPEEEVIGALTIVEDVTEAHRREQEVARLQEEIEQRKLVEIAKGILMRELDLSEDEGFRFIQKKSQDESRKMGEVARQVIDFFGSTGEREKLD